MGLGQHRDALQLHRLVGWSQLVPIINDEDWPVFRDAGQSNGGTADNCLHINPLTYSADYRNWNDGNCDTARACPLCKVPFKPRV